MPHLVVDSPQVVCDLCPHSEFSDDSLVTVTIWDIQIIDDIRSSAVTFKTILVRGLVTARSHQTLGRATVVQG